ncbi:MAG: IS21-like element helper ATPase IstB [Bacteroidales bacterium]|nr:IS21-like element helper ATPase IstB [Bacteroidales bacterium]
MTMTTESRINELLKYANTLQLSYLAAHFPEILHQAQVENPTYLEYSINTLKTEVDVRREREIVRRIKRAHLPRNCDLDKFDFTHGSGMTKHRLGQLRELLWVDQAYNIILMGPSGTGKTYIAAGLIYDAVMSRRNAMFGTMEEYVRILRTKDSLPKSMSAYNRILRCNLLCIDEITLMPLKREEAVAFFNLINALHEKTSIIITTNKAPTEWVEIFGDEALTSAILDRVLFHCDVIKLDGSSYRMDNRSGFLKDK